MRSYAKQPPRFSLATFTMLLIAGCGTMSTADKTCAVTPPADISSDRSAAVEAAADLTKFATAPVSANFKVDVKNVFKATFQKVPDKVAACAMLNQTYVCIRDRSRASEYLQFMKESGQCQVRD